MLISRHSSQQQEKNTPHAGSTYQWEYMHMESIACLCLYREHIIVSGKEGTASNPKNPDTSTPQFLSKHIDVAASKSRAAVTTTTTRMTKAITNAPRPGGSPGTAPAAPPEIPPWLQTKRKGNGEEISGFLKETVASVPCQKYQ